LYSAWLVLKEFVATIEVNYLLLHLLKVIPFRLKALSFCIAQILIFHFDDCYYFKIHSFDFYQFQNYWQLCHPSIIHLQARELINDGDGGGDDYDYAFQHVHFLGHGSLLLPLLQNQFLHYSTSFYTF